MNADGYINANGDLLGYNMFAYCGNNLVTYSDPEGEWIHIAIGVGIGAISGFVGSAISSYLTTGEVNWGQAFISAGFGALTGGLGAVGLPAGAMIVINAVLGATESIVSDLVENATSEGDEAPNDIVDITANALLSAGISALFSISGGSDDSNTLNSLYSNSKIAQNILKRGNIGKKMIKSAVSDIIAYHNALKVFTKNTITETLITTPISAISNIYAEGLYGYYRRGGR